MTSSDTDWPSLPLDDWEPTKATLHRCVQVVGKVRMALVPFRNHWWHVPLFVGTRGLTTGPMPYGGQRLEITFDFVEHALVVTTSTGERLGFSLSDGLTVAEFYRRLFSTLSGVGVAVRINPAAFELGDSAALDADTQHASYDPGAVVRFWALLRQVDAALQAFSGRFLGKSSPVHLFWHSLDLAHTRFSGRPAPVRDDADPVTAAAYSHEVCSFGFWAGDARHRGPTLYSYTAPEPDGLTERPLRPHQAWWDHQESGSQALLRYEDARATGDPAGVILDFLQSAYEAGADAAGWDRAGLDERHPERAT